MKTHAGRLTGIHSWDKNHGYKIEESKPVDNNIAELDQYAFVVRKQFGMNPTRSFARRC